MRQQLRDLHYQDLTSCLLQAEQAKRSYETTVATLKQKAAKRNEQDTRRWEARRQLVQQIYDSAQVRHPWSSGFRV